MFTDIMLDLETTGTSPDRAAIIQIAGVKFNLETREVDDTVFNRCLIPLPARRWEEGTRAFWHRDNTMRETLARITALAEDAALVMSDFVDWARGGHRLWGKPSHFEYPLIESYCRDLNLPNPFHYRSTNDLNTWLRARYWPQEPAKIDVPFDGTAHDALFDVFNQLQVLFSHADNTTQAVG